MNALPPGVSTTRLPTWLLPPNFDEDTRCRLRPDILIIDGLPLATFLSHKADIEASTPAGQLFINNLKRHPSTIIHLVELGYTSDASYAESLARKRVQHNRLAHCLLSAGWKLALSPSPPDPSHAPHAIGDDPADDAPPAEPLPVQLPDNIPDLSRYVHIILLGTSGIIYKPTDTICSVLGISPSETVDLLRALHLHTVRFLDTITRTRRRLELTLTTFSHIRTDTHPPDPP